jgi:site-specific DNA-methyltransferase (adenine-specific)
VVSGPYYEDDVVTLFHGDCRDLLPALDLDLCAAICDPPYAETSARWDQWPTGWVEAVTAALPPTASLWCFGSMRTHLEHAHEFFASGWKFGQDGWFDTSELLTSELLLWEKHNGPGPGRRDRLTKVHEIALHWYRGKWGELNHEWDRLARTGPDKGTVRRSGTRDAPHQNGHRSSTYVDDGTRQARSVIHVKAPSIRFQRRHPDEKPLQIVLPLAKEAGRPGQTLLDPTAGAGTTGIAARMLGMRAVLIESEEAMCETAALRLAAAAEDQLRQAVPQ